MSQTVGSLVGARIDRAIVESQSRSKGEPQWLRDWRLAAFDYYQAMPMPTQRDEEWRRTDLRALRLDDVIPWV
ncbi:MAG TPA: Fe-S cluster assembly protein SufD, partial [Chloroflexota bacterium]|nr:Fe-S cluster assembly protein SufD [Chloroflexota bacterium]